MGRKPFPLFNPLRTFVTNEFTRRKTSYPTPTISSFVRMTSCMGDSTHTPALSYFTLGLHGFDIQDIDIFEQSYTKQNDIVGYAYTNDGTKTLVHVGDLTRQDVPIAPTNLINAKLRQQIQKETIQLEQDQKIVQALGAHPIPGITKISVKRVGLGTPVSATVEFVCYNKNQMEFLRNLYMIAGSHVVIEWGNQFSDKRLNKILNFGSPDITQTLVKSLQEGRGYVIKNWVEPNEGNYDFLVGIISNFQMFVDARAGVWRCTVNLVGHGEQFRGISNFTTFFDKNNPEQRYATTIADYFKVGQEFDTLVNGPLSNDPSLVSPLRSKWTADKSTNVAPSDARNFSTNPEDYRFVSWKFFCQHLIPSVLERIKDLISRQNLLDLIQFWPPDGVTEDEDVWFGDNPHLKSTSPDIMLLIKKSMDGQIPQALMGAGYFDAVPGADGYRGKPTQGVWLNIGMIRNAFLQTSRLEEAIRAILSNMSAATDNFWQLMMYFDDDVNKYRIIDAKYGDPRHADEFYRFNEGGNGEVLEVNFDSAFPPELVTQMSLYGFFKSQPEWKKKELLEQLPATGAPNTFIFSMNWTNLQDLVSAQITKNQTATGNVNSTDFKVTSPTPDNTTAKSRVIPTSAAPATPVMADSKSPQPNKPLGASLVTNAVNTNPKGTPLVPVRNSIKGRFKTNPLDTITTLTDPRIDDEFKTRVQALITDIQTNHNKKVRVNETFRTQERQNALYQQGRGGDPRPVVTWTKTSYHSTGQAVDLLIFDGNKEITQQFFPTLQELAKAHDLDTLPARLGDYGHVQWNGPRKSTPPPSFDSKDLQTAAPADTGEVGVRQNERDAAAKQAEQQRLKEEDVKSRFGDSIPPLMELLPSGMTSRIIKDGYNAYPNPNGHVVAFPTTTEVTLTLQGTAGLSISDGFYVDKLPFVFERYGVFQIVEITEDIDSNQGWRTVIRGIFKLLWLDGDGNTRPKKKVT